MPRLLIGTCVVCVVATGSALGADLPRKVRPPAPPVLGWTGFYAGINAGGSIGGNRDAEAATSTSAVFGANGLWNSADKHASPGAVLGGQVGYNWQLPSRWLVGAEADWQWTSQRNLSADCAPPATIAFFGPGGGGFGYCFSDQSRITDFGTARARGGVLFGDSLLYATGGLAWGRVKDDFAFSGSATPGLFGGAQAIGPFLGAGTSYDKYRAGWTLGAGVESRIDASWSAKLEYLYVDLGTVSQTLPISTNPAFVGVFVAGDGATATRSSHVTDNIVRLGLNYHFSPLGTAATAPGLLPLKAPPAPALVWSGFYAGLNVGGAIGVNTDAQRAVLASPTLGTNVLLDTGDKHASPGAVAGGQIGYNWQVFSRWLVGLELDWQWTPQMNFASASTPASATTSFFNFGGSGFGYGLSNETRITNFGTERLRAGVLAGDSLWYATGGVAWGTVKDNFAFAGSGASFPPFSGVGAVGSSAVSVSKTRIGWTLGGGVETKLDSRWSAKIEYLYVDLGTVTQTLDIPVNAAFTGGGASASALHSTHVTDNIIRAGVNYRLF